MPFVCFGIHKRPLEVFSCVLRVMGPPTSSSFVFSNGNQWVKPFDRVKLRKHQRVRAPLLSPGLQKATGKWDSHSTRSEGPKPALSPCAQSCGNTISSSSSSCSHCHVSTQTRLRSWWIVIISTK